MSYIISKIKNIRNKPENTRKMILWTMVFVCMVFVAGIWVFTFLQRRDAAGDLFSLDLENDTGYESLTKDFEDLEKDKNEAMENAVFEVEKAEIQLIAKKYIEESDSLKGGNFEDLKLERVEKWNGNWYLSYRQYYKDILVEKSVGGLTIDAGTKTVTSAGFNSFNDIEIDVEPEIDKEIALDTVRDKAGIENLELKSFQIVIYKDIKNEKYHLVWELVVYSDKPIYNYKYFVDAKTGDILDNYNLFIE